jgi:hypothetical protein
LEALRDARRPKPQSAKLTSFVIATNEYRGSGAGETPQAAAGSVDGQAEEIAIAM